MKTKFTLFIKKLSNEDCRLILTTVTKEISNRDQRKKKPSVSFRLAKILTYEADVIENLVNYTKKSFMNYRGCGIGVANYAEKLLKRKGLKFKQS